MNIYRPKALIDGYKLGEEYAGKTYVAVPRQKVLRNYHVAFGKSIIATENRKPDMRLKFADNWGRGAYWLYYYEWKPEKLTIGAKII